MNCFPCFRKSQEDKDLENVPVAQPKDVAPNTPAVHAPQAPSTEKKNDDAKQIDNSDIDAKNFTFRELATATKNFRQECLLGEGGFGRVYRGTIQSSGQVVAVKQLDKNTTQGSKEFLVEVLMLSLLHHPNLLNLVGYCADGDQRLLVYEYMPRGSVEEHILGLKMEGKPLDWVTRMKIACGTAQGLQYLHEKANPPIIYRDLKCSNILLDDQFNPKLADYGLAKLGGNKGSHVTPKVLGSYGYSAPEFDRYGELTLKSDVYNFGVILLELITGRRAMDTSKPADEQNLVAWAKPIFRDPKRFPEMADPLIKNEFPVKSLNQAVGVAAMCLQDEPDVRPLIGDVVASLSFLTVAQPESPAQIEQPISAPLQSPAAPSEMKAPSRKESRHDKKDGNLSDYSGSSSEYSDSDCEDSKTYQQEPKADNHEESDTCQHERRDRNATHQENVEYEVASMSSSSDSNVSDYESQYGSTSHSGKIQHGNSSVKLKRKSTKKSQEGSVHSSRSSSRQSSQRGSSSRQSSQRGSTGLSSKRSSNIEPDSGSVNSILRQKSSMRSETGSIGSSYSRKSSNASSKNGSVRSAQHYGNNESIGSSYSRHSSKAGSEKGSVRSAHDSDSESEESDEELKL